MSDVERLRHVTESRAVFLDVDGVLAPWGRAGRALDPSCVDRIRRLAEHARVVLTSTWSIEAAVASGVPVDDALDRDTERRAPERARLRGIHRYLSEHPEINEWISIDDDLQVDVLKRTRGPWAATLLAHEHRFLLTDWRCVYPVDDVPMSEGSGLPEGSGITEVLYLRALAVLGVEPR